MIGGQDLLLKGDNCHGVNFWRFGSSIVNTLTVAFVAFLTAAGGVAQAATPLTAPTEVVCKNVQAGEARVQIGDRIKLTIYERTDDESAVLNDRSHSANGLRSYRLRAEVSGDFDVDEGGSVALPLLGQISMAGRPVLAVRDDISKAFEAALGHVGLITLSITEHQPVYVIGPVKNPGAYKFVPGMSLLQTIALAGGFERGSIELNQILSSLNEVERNKRSAETLKRLLARDAVLRAEQQGTPVAPPKALIAMSDEAEAKQLVDYEKAQREAGKTSADLQLQSINISIAKAQEAIHSRTQQLAIQADVVKAREERLGTLRGLIKKGVTATSNVNTAAGEFADALLRAQEIKLGIEQDNAQLLEAQASLSKQVVMMRTELPRAVADTGAQIAQETKVYQSSSAGLDMINQRLIDPDVSTEQSKVGYEVIRRTTLGLQALSADGFCDLQPGDLVRVRMRKVENAPS